MELGSGKWGNDPKDLIALRDQFLSHLEEYERILILRTLKKPPDPWFYELVEIPKELFLRAQAGRFEMQMASRQFPKPGYCRVYSDGGELQFELYFDGGTERKLQIKKLKKDFCRIHATWKINATEMLL